MRKPREGPRAPQPYDPPQSLVELLIDVSDRATEWHTMPGDDPETFLECLLCGEWEGHADLCPMPAIERWLSEPVSKPESKLETEHRKSADFWEIYDAFKGSRGHR